MQYYPSEIYCDVHGCIHDAKTNPYDYYYGPDEEPECGPDDWYNLWVGAKVLKKPVNTNDEPK